MARSVTPPSSRHFLHAAAEIFEVPVQEITAPGRAKQARLARWAVIANLRRLGLSSAAVARIVKRDHTTILDNEKRIAQIPGFEDQIEAVRMLAREFRDGRAALNREAAEDRINETCDRLVAEVNTLRESLITGARTR